MAKAEKSRVEVTKIEEGVTLHLSMAEARALAAIGTRVGGDPGNTPRGQIDAINRALQDALTVGGRQYDWGWFDKERAALGGGSGLCFGPLES